jgi:UDP-N-acetylglucosamine--N-acetylmuramyl-(pentapeptide) pyrophosphoryl-undecaprenol N-acetylglucosamine transferase
VAWPAANLVLWQLSRYKQSSLQIIGPEFGLMTHSQHIVFAGGGTAGHLFPGLAVAEELTRSNESLRITFVGTGKPFEEHHVTAAGHDYLPLRCRPFPDRPRDALRFVTDNLWGYYAAKRFLREHEVSLVVGLGGYASASATRAAAALQIPYILLEQNAIPGKATRWLAPQAALVCGAFSGVTEHLRPATRVRVTGTPVRRQFLQLRAAQAAPGESRALRLIVLGGSGGSRTLNETVPLAIYKAKSGLADWQIVHQTGQREVRDTAALYGKLGLVAEVAPFFDNLPQLLSSSDLAVSRAGGTTLAELAVCGVPSILLPYPRAADDHQRHNADLFAAAKAARIFDVREVDGRFDNALARILTELTSNDSLRRRMGHNAARLARPDATRRVAKLIVQLVAERQIAAA